MSFKNLNLEYLLGYDHRAGKIPRLLEPQDLVVIDHPVEHVLRAGGQIWFAELAGHAGPVGSVSIQPGPGSEWELSTLAVTPAAQGRKIGLTLVRTAIEYARLHGATRIVLDTSTVLVAAVKLYEAIGFKRMARPRGIYETADLAMELKL